MGPFNPFRFGGVIGRLQYAGYSAVWLALLALSGAAMFVGINASRDITAAVLAFTVLLPLTSVARISYAMRRLRHIGWHPAWSVLAFVPMAAFGLDLALLALPGAPDAPDAPDAPGPAELGRDPRNAPAAGHPAGGGVDDRTETRWTDAGWVEVPADDGARDDDDQT